MNLIFCHSKKKCKNRWKCPNPKFRVHFHPSKIFFFAKKKIPSVSIHQKPLKKHWDIWFCEILQFSTLPTEQAATSEKPNSSPPRETSRPPPFEFNGGFVYCEKCPVGVLSLDALCLDPYKCADDCGLSHYHRKYNGDDVVWAFRNRDTGDDILHCLGSCPPPPGCPCCRVWRP